MEELTSVVRAPVSAIPWSPGISKGSTVLRGALSGSIHAVLDAPVHDVANEGAGEETQQLHDSKDGGVELHWVGTGWAQDAGSSADTATASSRERRAPTASRGPKFSGPQDWEKESHPRHGARQDTDGPGFCLALLTCPFHLLFLLGRLCG